MKIELQNSDLVTLISVAPKDSLLYERAEAILLRRMAYELDNTAPQHPPLIRRDHPVNLSKQVEDDKEIPFAEHRGVYSSEGL